MVQAKYILIVQNSMQLKNVVSSNNLVLSVRSWMDILTQRHRDTENAEAVGDIRDCVSPLRSLNIFLALLLSLS